jgi:hypothetical protein
LVSVIITEFAAILLHFIFPTCYRITTHLRGPSSEELPTA